MTRTVICAGRSGSLPVRTDLQSHSPGEDAGARLTRRALHLVGSLTPRRADRLGRLMGDLWFALDQRRRAIAAANLDLAFGPGLTRAERRCIARHSFRSLAVIPLEIAWSLRHTRAENLARIRLRGQTYLEAALSAGKGALVLTAHTGNWELLTVATAALSIAVNIVYRPLDNPALDRFMCSFRTRFGARLIPRADGLRSMLRALRRGEAVALLLDQNVGWRKGVFADFFGHRACTHKAMALLALKTGAPVVPLFIRREGGSFCAEFQPAIETLVSGDRTADLDGNTRRYNQAIEGFIRRHPDQWLWLHRRWKTRPYCPWPKNGRWARQPDMSNPSPLSRGFDQARRLHKRIVPTAVQPGVPLTTAELRILLIRTGAIGDIVMASPLLKALRFTYPRAHLAWLADPAMADLLHPNPLLDEVIVWSRQAWSEWLRTGRWGSLLRDLLRLRRDLRQRRFTLALDIQGLLKSRLLAALSGAPQRIGFDAKEPGGFLMTRIISRGSRSRQMSSEYRYMARCLELRMTDPTPMVALSAEDRRSAGALLRSLGVSAPYAVLCPFTTRPQKHWIAARWPELARQLHVALNLPSVLLGGPADREAAAGMQRAAGAVAANIAGAARLGQSAAVLSGAALVVGVDTGLTHMGTAFRRPTIALFGATCPYRETTSPLTRVLYHPRTCAPCRRRPICRGAFPCMAAIEVPEVLTAARELIV